MECALKKLLLYSMLLLKCDVKRFHFQSENIVLDPELKAACSYDAEQFCKNVSPGRSAVIECLKKHQAELDNKCKEHIFDREVRVYGAITLHIISL